MFAELWFVYGLLFFIGVVLFMRAGRFVATHILQKKSCFAARPDALKEGTQHCLTGATPSTLSSIGICST